MSQVDNLTIEPTKGNLNVTNLNITGNLTVKESQGNDVTLGSGVNVGGQLINK